MSHQHIFLRFLVGGVLGEVLGEVLVALEVLVLVGGGLGLVLVLEDKLSTIFFLGLKRTIGDEVIDIATIVARPYSWPT